MPIGGSRSLCAVRAYGALCAEAGDAGKAYSLAAQPGSPPWAGSDPMRLLPGASAKRTVQTFASMFGEGTLQLDADGRWTGAAAQLHQRGADVKKALKAGCCTEQQLHGKLSWAAWNACALRGTTLIHAASGECAVCAAHLPQEYDALKPQLGGKGGRPPKKQRKRRDRAGCQ